jgi:hypothetical protein
VVRDDRKDEETYIAMPTFYVLRVAFARDGFGEQFLEVEGCFRFKGERLIYHGFERKRLQYHW